MEYERSISRWINELEEYSFWIEYRPGKSNFVADALSRNLGADDIHPNVDTNWEEKIYLVNELSNEPFKKQLLDGQNKDPVIKDVKDSMSKNAKIRNSRYYRVRNQLRIENDLLVKSGRPVTPPSLQKFVIGKMHFGCEKLYYLTKERFYWPNQQYTRTCETCQNARLRIIHPKHHWYQLETLNTLCNLLPFANRR